MSKELPYFRFHVQEWQNGKISLEDFHLQGLFISICGHYWIKDCNMTLDMLEKRYGPYRDGIDLLINLNIIKHESDTGKIDILFLNDQFSILSNSRKARQKAGSKGGKQKNKKAEPPPKKEPGHKYNDKDSYKKFIDKFNEITKKNYKGSEMVKKQLNARLKNNYTLDEIFRAIETCHKDKYHQENPQFLTPEFITRADKLEKYLNATSGNESGFTELPNDEYEKLSGLEKKKYQDERMEFKKKASFQW